MHIFKTSLLFLSIFLFAGCSLVGKSVEESKTRFEIGVSILPYQGLVQRIVGDEVTVFSIVPEGYSHETYEPSPQEMKRLMGAKLVILNGSLPYEENIETALKESNPDIVLVKLNDSLDDSELLPLEHAHDEDEHDDEGGDDQEGESEHLDPHTWFSPRLVIKQIPAILIALQKVDSDHTDIYVNNAVGLVTDLEALSAEITAQLQKHWGRSFLVYHPAFGYYAQEYGLKQRFIEIEGKEPSATQVKEILELVESEQITVVYLEKQFATRTAEALAEELAVPVEYVNPLAADYLESLRTFTNQLVNNF